MFYSVQQVVCNFLSLTNGSSWFKVIKVIASSTRASKHMVNKNRMPGKGCWRELKKPWIITSLINY